MDFLKIDGAICFSTMAKQKKKAITYLLDFLSVLWCSVRHNVILKWPNTISNTK